VSKDRTWLQTPSTVVTSPYSGQGGKGKGLEYSPRDKDARDANSLTTKGHKGLLLRDDATPTPSRSPDEPQNGLRVTLDKSAGTPPQLDILTRWRRDQHEIKRSVASEWATLRGDRQWSSSTGQVPPPSSAIAPQPLSSPTTYRPPRQDEDPEADGGMDIFEMLDRGPQR
jgi:hypothetical protein